MQRKLCLAFAVLAGWCGMATHVGAVGLHGGGQTGINVQNPGAERRPAGIVQPQHQPVHQQPQHQPPQHQPNLGAGNVQRAPTHVPMAVGPGQRPAFHPPAGAGQQHTGFALSPGQTGHHAGVPAFGGLPPNVGIRVDGAARNPVAHGPGPAAHLPGPNPAGVVPHQVNRPVNGLDGNTRAIQPGVRPGNVTSQPIQNWQTGHMGSAASWNHFTPEAARTFNDRFNNIVRPGTATPTPNSLHNWVQNHPERINHWQDWANRIQHGPQIGGDAWSRLHPGMVNNLTNNSARVRPGTDWWSRQRPAVNNNVAVRPGSYWWTRYHPDTLNRIQNHFDYRRPGSNWWVYNHPRLSPWYYQNAWPNYSWWYWWGVPTWTGLAAWYPTWGTPVYYDYGPGGNVIYQGDAVYVNGQNVGTPLDYAQSASLLATVDPTFTQQIVNDEFMPLGTFSLSTSTADTAPNRILQLAVDKYGIISGTMYNTITDQTYIVQGRVDPQSQRVAFTVGNKFDTVLETGIYNLTQPQTPLLVHFGDGRTDTFLLMRLEPPESET